MMGREEIADFKKKHFAMENEIGEIGTKQFPSIVKLAGMLKDLMDGIEGIQEKEKKLHDPHVSERIRIMKKGIKLAKNVKYFEDNVVIEFSQGNIQEKTGKKFVEITKLIKKNQMPMARKDFGHFQKMLDLHKAYEESREKMRTEEKILRKELHQAESTLAGIAWLEQQKIDLEKLRKYQEWQESALKLEKFRQDYLISLSARPAAELLENEFLAGSQFPSQSQKEKIRVIQEFFSRYPELKKYTAAQICGLFSASEKKLSHVCPETSRFRNSIVENKQIFETLHSLSRTDLLAINPDDSATMEFYSKNVPGAESPVAKLREIAPKKQECEAECQKQKKMDEKRKELEGVSREKLEAHLEETQFCIELLDSAPEGPQPEEKEEKKESLFSKVASFFRG